MENVIRSGIESAVNQTSNKFTQLSIDLAGKTNTGPVLASCGDSDPEPEPEPNFPTECIETGKYPWERVCHQAHTGGGGGGGCC
jgi:hypothetical protein